MFLFGCPPEKDFCEGSSVFSAIALILLTLVFIALIPSTPQTQTIVMVAIAITFTIIGFIPLWLTGTFILIGVAWSVFQ
jgi:hypothetical protein